MRESCRKEEESLETLAGCLAIAIGVAFTLALCAMAIGAILKGRRGSSGTLSSAMLEIQSLLEPGQRHVRGAEEEEPQGENESGEPPSDGNACQ